MSKSYCLIMICPFSGITEKSMANFPTVSSLNEPNVTSINLMLDNYDKKIYLPKKKPEKSENCTNQHGVEPNLNLD